MVYPSSRVLVLGTASNLVGWLNFPESQLEAITGPETGGFQVTALRNPQHINLWG